MAALLTASQTLLVHMCGQHPVAPSAALLTCPAKLGPVYQANNNNDPCSMMTCSQHHGGHASILTGMATKNKVCCAVQRLRQFQHYKETCMQSNDQARLQVGRVQPQIEGMTKVGACCPTISTVEWPDLTPKGFT